MNPLILNIHNDTTLREIKAEFTRHFPFLKLEFFRKSHGHGEASPAKEMLSDELSIGEARGQGEEGDFSVPLSLSVEQLEDAFDRRFGLHVQVFRKSGKIWLETSVTDQWSLERQNSHGQESTSRPD